MLEQRGKPMLISAPRVVYCGTSVCTAAVSNLETRCLRPRYILPFRHVLIYCFNSSMKYPECRDRAVNDCISPVSTAAGHKLEHHIIWPAVLFSMSTQRPVATS